MALMDSWKKMAYDETIGRDKLQRVWNTYFMAEKEMYQKLLADPKKYEKATVAELAGLFDVDMMTMTGFMDGINDSLVEKNDLDTMEEDTVVNLVFDKELLYKNMVAAQADWLYNLEEWDAYFDEATKKHLYKEQKISTTVVKDEKVYPNDPCPCGSGKKYKKCCGKK